MIGAMPACRHRASPVALCLLATAACVNLHAVEEGRVYRCAQPSEPHLEALIWRYRLETVLCLRRDETSQPAALDAGIDWVQVPMSARHFPERTTLEQLCEVFATARYPLLIHCRAGADRTGLASAIYVLERTGDLEAARAQLGLEYLHVGWGGTERLDELLDLYAPCRERMTFCEWAREVYERPPEDLVTAEYEEQLARAFARWQEGAGR